MLNPSIPSYIGKSRYLSKQTHYITVSKNMFTRESVSEMLMYAKAHSIATQAGADFRLGNGKRERPEA